MKDLAFADLHAVEAGGHGLAPLEEAFVALVLATVGHIGRLVDKDVGRKSGCQTGEVTLLRRRGHVEFFGVVESGENLLCGADVVAGSPHQSGPGGGKVVGGHDGECCLICPERESEFGGECSRKCRVGGRD